ncbi:MAG: hypothetical protein ABI479_10980, partial [Gallionella sp.]
MRFRLLAHVPQSNGEAAFSCLHCGAVLTCNETPLGKLFWATKWRRIFTLLAGMAILSGISLGGGK